MNSLAKVFEKIVTRKLTVALKPILTEHQHGFMSKKSTVTNLAIISHYILQAVERRHQVDVVYMDFAKAFDVVPHLILFNKLSAYGISGPLLEWLKSYLLNRSQFVEIDNGRSENFKITSGVPQGSNLGPLFFLLFINDLPLFIKYCNILLFADDTKLFLEIKDSKDALLLQSDLDNFSNWCVLNHMSLNVAKCKAVRYTNKRTTIDAFYLLANQTLQFVNQIRDLGVEFQSDCKFTNHINNVGKSALRTLGFINRSLTFINPSTYILLYNTLVRSIMEYATSIWCPYSH